MRQKKKLPDTRSFLHGIGELCFHIQTIGKNHILPYISLISRK